MKRGRPCKIHNKKIKINTWVKPGVRIALNDLSRMTGKSKSDLIETAINDLFLKHTIQSNELKAICQQPEAETIA